MDLELLEYKLQYLDLTLRNSIIAVRFLAFKDRFNSYCTYEESEQSSSY